MFAGAVVSVVMLLLGDLTFDTNISVVATILGTVVSLLLAKLVEFFAFNVDYTRTEYVQFEDDVLIGMVPDAGDVSADDADLVAFGNDFGERLAADRVTHTFQGSGFNVAGRSRGTFEDVEDVFFRQGNFLGGLTKAEFKFF